MTDPQSPHRPLLSIVVPALNEQENVGPLVEQIKRAVVEPDRGGGIDAELIVVDDGSNDATLERLTELAGQYPWLRVLHRRRTMGQSATMFAGIHAARGRFVATLDADLQNDPADLPKLLEHLRHNQADLVQGDRSANRRDNLVRRVSSWVGQTTRKLILSDPIRDTGCSTRVLTADLARQLPLQFAGMHRFIPHYARMIGATIIEMPVNHRPRRAGVAKYGVFNRGLVGLCDCFAVRWMTKRYRDTTAAAPPNRKTPS